MTVAELIAELQKLPGDLEVQCWDGYDAELEPIDGARLSHAGNYVIVD